MNSLLAVAGIVVITVVAGIIATPIAKRREIAARRAGTYADGFVMVEDDGSVRELTADERAHINREYEFGDGARPYVKERYKSLTPDGRMSGYLERSQVPLRIRFRARS